MRSAVSIRRFNDLMLFRIREVLLVSSRYDYFILQEDGTLTEQVFIEYEEFSLSAAPRFTHANNAEEALARLQERRFDLILIMAGLEMDVAAFATGVKKKRPDLPIVLLSLDQQDDAGWRQQGASKLLDGVFVWTGDAKILLAIFKLIEDRRNVEHDVRHGNLRVIIVVEDSVHYYSLFLRVLYNRLMKLARALYSEGTSRLYRLMYMRSRPKLLHARSFEEGLQLLEKYGPNVFALISDIRVPRRGQLDPGAGLELVRRARANHPELPVLLQSAEASGSVEATELGTAFVEKNSPNLVKELDNFLTERLGFADFVFRLPDGTEVARAHSLQELERALQTVPDESLLYHAARNHFSLWLMARSEFELADRMQPQRVDDFAGAAALREYVVEALREARQTVHSGTISDFRPEQLERTQFSRIGTGNLGGKARGIAFLHKLLADHALAGNLPMPVLFPKTVVITTQEFERFVKKNELEELSSGEADDIRINQRFLEGRLSEELRHDLRSVVTNFKTPLAVRSSSLLEDSLHQPFAGIYSTLMIPNSDPDPEERLNQLCSAIKLVFASTFHSNARGYLGSAGKRRSDERMAVIIQELVGQQYGNRYYPAISGVAQSHNFYPIGPQKSSEGVALVALGLGKYIVEGQPSLRFCPLHPAVIPEFATPAKFADSSQKGFWALRMDREVDGLQPEGTLEFLDLKVAEEDGTLSLVGSVYAADDRRIRDDLTLAGPRLVTFNNVLKHKSLPLAETLAPLVDLIRREFGSAVEVEFACDVGDWGRRRVRGVNPVPPRLFLLQARPLAGVSSWEFSSRVEFAPSDLLCSTDSSLGQGIRRNIRDIVFVHPDRWQAAENRAIAAEIAEFNSRLVQENRPYLLIGPGRWGSADPWLGVPVQWSQISGARVIVEVSPRSAPVTPSQGTHFFHNITSLGIGYLTLSSIAGGEEGERGSKKRIDWDWLKAQTPVNRSTHVDQVQFESPLTVVLDGRNGWAAVAKPEARPTEAPQVEPGSND